MNSKTIQHASRIALAGVLAGSAAVASAEWEPSANVSIVTDYVFRGISQTDEDPAIQGGFDIGHSSGFYAGIWGSNVDFDDGDEAHLELDYYVGFANEFANGLGYDVGFLYYDYPGASSSLDYDFWEVYAGLSYTFDATLEPTVGLKVNYSDEFFGDTGDALYWDLSLGLSLPYDLALDLHWGYQDLDDDYYDPDSYQDWKVGLTKTWKGFDFGLTYYDTNSDGEDLAGDLADDRIVFGISKSI